MSESSIKDPIAGLVLAMCDYLALVQTGSAAEELEAARLMQVRQAVVVRIYVKGIKHRKVDAVEAVDDVS